jgi:hypothetical protein
LFKGRQRQQGCVQRSGSARRSSCDAGSHHDDEDDRDNDRAPLRLHQGRQRQQGCLQDRRCTNAHGPLSGGREDDNENDVYHDGLHQVVQ